MLKYSRWQTIAIFLVLALGLVFASPNLVPKDRLGEIPGWIPKTRVNLGLDLQGGSYLLLGVETDKVINDRLTALRQDIQREMRPSGANLRIVLADLPKLNAETSTVSVTVRDDAQAEEAAKRVRDLTRGTTLAVTARAYDIVASGRRIDVTMSPEAKRQYASQALSDSIEVVRRRIDPAGNKEVSIQPQGVNRIVIQVPGDNDPESLKALINRTGQLSFHRADLSVAPQDAQAGLLPPGRILVQNAASEGAGAMVLFEDPEVTGDMVENAAAGLNPDGAGFQINFSFDGRGARRFADYTRDHVGEIFAIVLDNEIISAPRIQTPITGGSGRITGNFAPEEANRIATLIRSGALPAPLTTLEQRSIGPGLGKDSIAKGSISLLAGFLGIAIYMIVTYGRFGVYAVIALFGNAALNGGALSLFGSTLTLPGVAGILLTIGMAVDANVLIFERTREELRGGKSVVNAVATGFDKAWTAILDTHVTTFFTALIMFILGAGPVRGFAVTLAVGTVTSMFSAIVVTKMLAGQYVLSRRPKTLVL